MSKHLRAVGVTLAVLWSCCLLHAQFTGARYYENAPVGVNELELAYGYAHSNASIDTSLIVTGAHFNLNQGTVTYTRYFGLLRHALWAQASVPIAGLSGSVSGTKIQSSVTGTGDSSYTLTALLKGGPALHVAEFDEYKPTTTLGLSLTVSAPTGQYDSNRLLNLGSERWSFKPEIGVAHPFGPEQKWDFDFYAHCYFFTDNTTYRGKEILRQEPLPGVEGHLSYYFLPSVWGSVDGIYAFRGSTLVDGVDQKNSQQNFGMGGEVNVSLNDQNTLAFQFSKSVVHQNGPQYTGFAVKYSYSWGKGFR
jgi:hypothetical protein